MRNLPNNWGNVLEYKDITITGKRQITIPKSFYDNLGLEENIQAYLLEDGIFLKPVQKPDTVQEEDIQSIIRKVMKEGYSGEEMVKELSQRISQYNKFLDKRIQEFIRDVEDDSVSDEGAVDFNGLEFFFNQENGTIEESDQEEK